MNQYNTTTIRFAVYGNQEWIYDNQGRIVFLEGWQEKANIKISSFADSEAVCDFIVDDGELFVSIISFEERDYITWHITYSEGQLYCTDCVPGRIIQKQVIENIEEAKELLSNVKISWKKKDEYHFVAQQGVMDLGTGNDGYRYVLSREIVNNEEKEYYIQKIYAFSSDGSLKHVYNLPNMIPTCDSPVRMFEGEIYFLDTEESYVRLATLENSIHYSVENCLMPFNWSGNNTENNSAENSDASAGRATTSVTRASCIGRFDSYCTPFTWSCSATNLLPLSGWICPHYISGAGSYNSMPYCWGGFSNWDAFNNGVRSGYRIGNVNINGAILSNTVGTDCSGAASRALALSYHCTTSSMPGICTLSTWTGIRTADLILNPGSHVLMYYYTTESGLYCVYECTVQGNVDRCMKRFRTASALSAYSIYSYSGFSD